MKFFNIDRIECESLNWKVINTKFLQMFLIFKIFILICLPNYYQVSLLSIRLSLNFQFSFRLSLYTNYIAYELRHYFSLEHTFDINIIWGICIIECNTRSALDILVFFCVLKIYTNMAHMCTNFLWFFRSSQPRAWVVWSVICVWLRRFFVWRRNSVVHERSVITTKNSFEN